MRTILYVSASGAISGAERSLLTMLDALDQAEYTPVVAAPAGDLLSEVRARGIRTLYAPLAPLMRPRTLRAGWEIVHTVRVARNAMDGLLTEINPDIVHANTTSAMTYTTRATCPVIWQVRDLSSIGQYGSLLYQRATRVAVISSAVREHVLSYAFDNGEKIRLLPPAVDTTKFTPRDDVAQVLTKLGLPVDVPLIGLVAQFVPWKRHDLLLDALEQMQDEKWHAVLCGADFGHRPDYVNHLQARIARSPIANRISWLPWQVDSAPLLAALDVLALTSKREPFGRALLEAMSCGTAVVAVDEGGVRDFISPDNTGILIAADKDELTAALKDLLADPEKRTQLGVAARESVVASFNLTNQRILLNDLYQEL